MQFMPIAYIVKLNIELSMASLIAKIARDHHSTPFLMQMQTDIPLAPLSPALIIDTCNKELHKLPSDRTCATTSCCSSMDATMTIESVAAMYNLETRRISQTPAASRKASDGTTLYESIGGRETLDGGGAGLEIQKETRVSVESSSEKREGRTKCVRVKDEVEEDMWPLKPPRPSPSRSFTAPAQGSQSGGGRAGVSAKVWV